MHQLNLPSIKLKLKLQQSCPLQALTKVVSGVDKRSGAWAKKLILRFERDTSMTITCNYVYMTEEHYCSTLVS